MDLIPLPDDIPVPEDPPVPTDTTILPQPPVREEDLVSDAISSLTGAIPEGLADDLYGDTADNTVVDMEYQDCASDTAPETCEIVGDIIPPDEGATADHPAKDTFFESHDMLNSKADVPVPGESEHELLIENSEQTLSEEVKKQESAAASSEIPLQVPEQYDPPAPENTVPAAELTAVVDPALQNNQMQYSATNYMYPPMGDPSMMSHNYQYMTTPSNYNDYLSMYHAANRMPRSYGNAYAQYPGYNYAYPPMQQMYDGRNMAAYPAGNYSAQMMTPTTPMLTGMNSFTPPLPSDYPVPVVFPSSNNSASPLSTSSVNQQQLQVEKSEASDKAAEVELLPPLPETNVVEESTSDVVDEKKPEDEESPPVPPDVSESEQDKEPTDDQDQKTVSQVNHVSEDVNRYSPSLPMDEDDAGNQPENVDNGSQIRPPQKISSVLGKAQAKKRLMAFSFSKQTAAAHVAAKKQAQETASSNNTTSTRNLKKENGEMADVTNHSRVEHVEVPGSVFEDKQSKKKQRKTVQKEKARETIEEIEELKRTEMIMSTNALIYRKNLLNDGNNVNSSETSKRSSSRRRSRSRSGSRNRRYSRSRSRERKFSRHDRKYRRRSRSRTRSKSRSLSRSSSVPDRKSKLKTSDIKSWDDFRESGFRLDKYRRIKFKENTNLPESEVERRKKEALSKHRHRRSRSKEDSKSRSRRSRSKGRTSVSIEKEVVAEIRMRKVNFLGMPIDIKQPLKVPRDGFNVDDPIEYPSHIMQYTNCKPVIRYCANPKYATHHFINRAQLLETIPDDIAALVRQFWSSIKPKRLKDKFVDQTAIENGVVDNSKSIRWWSESPLEEENLPSDEEIEIDNEDISAFAPLIPENDTADENASTKTLEKTTRVRKSRFEEADDANQGVSIVVRSRWDSDYEGSPENTQTVPKKTPKEDQTAYPLSPRNEVTSVIDEPRKTKHKESSSRKHDPEAKGEHEEDVSSRASDSNESRSRKHSDRRKWEEGERHHEARKSKSAYESTAESNDTEREFKKSTQSATEMTAGQGGDHKLVSEYEEFLKMVNFEQPKDDSTTPLYEGPKPPPLWTKKVSENTASISELPSTVEKKPCSVDQNLVATTEDKEERMVVSEDEFDVDKFFLKEKEKKLKKLSLRNATEPSVSILKELSVEPAISAPKESAIEPPSSVPKESQVEVEVELLADSKHDKKLEKKDKKKKKKKVVSAKAKKRSTKHKKKRAVDKRKKKKASSDSSSGDSSDESSDSSSKVGSSSSSTISSSSSSSSNSSSSSDSNSSSSEPRKKRKKTKKLKKKERKRTKSSGGDRHKRKKRKLKAIDSDSEDKKSKKKSKNEDPKKSKSKKLSSENFMVLLEKSLSTIKKSEAEESSPTKGATKGKDRKRKKKHDKNKEKKDLLNMIAPDLPEEVKNNLLEEIAESSDGVSKSKKKKRKVKKRKGEAADMSDDEATSSGWKKKKIDPRELEENTSKVPNAFLGEGAGVVERKTPDKASPNTKKRKKKLKRKRESGTDLSTDEQPSWKKKIDPKEIEESVAKAQRDSFFEENLDDWDNSSTGTSVVKHSMRDDDSKNEQGTDEEKGKKKKKLKKRSKYQKGKTEKRPDKKHKKDSQHGDKKSKKRAVKDEKFDLEDIPLPDSAKPTVSEEKRNFAMFSRNMSDRTDDEGRKDSSQDSPSLSHHVAEQSFVPSSDKYSPTQDADEEETQQSENSKAAVKGVPPPNMVPVPDDSYSFSCITNTTSGLFPCFQNSSTIPSVVPCPVPAPCPVPPPSKYPVASKDARVASAPSPGKQGDPEDDDDKSDETSLGCKSFSIAKVEFRTKAALKCFSSNVFDSVDGGEKSGSVALPLSSEVTENSNKLTEVVADSNKMADERETGDKDIPKEDARSEHTLQEPSPSCDTSRLNDKLSQPEPKRPASPKEVDRTESQRSDRHRSPSRDRSSKRRSRHDREDSYDNYRRRSRSRGRYKKYYRKERYKRRSRSRSRSRTRRRSRDRDHYRHKRTSYSNERAMERKRSRSVSRSPSYDRRKSRDLPNSAEFDNNMAAISKPELEECWDDLKTEEHRRKISEITRYVRDMETSNSDPHTLKENLFQLKETLQNFSRQGLPMDSLRNVLTVLENIPLTQGGRRTGAGDGEVTYQNIVSVWHSIQNILPSPLAYEARLDPRINRSPQDAKKTINADSTNNNYSQPNKIFDIRSREISPKPLSLDERLELELGVKRTMPTMPPPPVQGAYYAVGVYDGVPNFSAPPPPIPSFPPPMMNCTPPDHRYFGVTQQPPPPIAWNNRDPFVRPDLGKLPPPMMRPTHQIPPPQRMVQQPPEPAPVQKSAPYLVPSDVAGSKVHSIQVGNVLQIVPTELQPAASSSQPRVPSSAAPAPVVASSVAQPLNLLPASINPTAVNPMIPSMRDFSSLLSAHLPSFAAAPAVSGAKPSVGNDPPAVREHRLVPNDPRHKAKDPPPPPSPASIIPEVDMKKMLRIGKDKRKEEKALQSMLRGRAQQGTPTTPTNEENNLYDDVNEDGQDEHVTIVSIKPSPEQGILVSPGFRDKATPVTPLGRSIIGSTRKMVSFVDGIRPGSTGVYDSLPAKTRRPSPPPSPVSSAPPRKKHKVRVKLIRPDDSDDDDDAPPPPPPGPPPPELYPPSLGALGVLPPGFILPKL